MLLLEEGRDALAVVMVVVIVVEEALLADEGEDEDEDEDEDEEEETDDDERSEDDNSPTSSFAALLLVPPPALLHSPPSFPMAMAVGSKSSPSTTNSRRAGGVTHSPRTERRTRPTKSFTGQSSPAPRLHPGMKTGERDGSLSSSSCPTVSGVRLRICSGV